MPEIDAIARGLGMRLVAELDVNVAYAIRKKVGHDDWVPEDFRGRLHEVRRAGVDGSTFHLDGEPILWVGPIDITIEEGMLNAKRAYRVMV